MGTLLAWFGWLSLLLGSLASLALWFYSLEDPLLFGLRFKNFGRLLRICWVRRIRRMGGIGFWWISLGLGSIRVRRSKEVSWSSVEYL